MADVDLAAAHRDSMRHREQILASERCGCFCCCSVFAPAKVEEWVDAGQTALCPLCGIDAVIGSASGYPINVGFLRLMESQFFAGDRVNAGTVQAAKCALGDRVSELAYPLLFLTISGAHLYGFPSEDSDLDLRGAHILPAPKMLGLDAHDETVEWCTVRGGWEIDLVTHDVRKFFLLLLKHNGYVLEQLYSPLVVHTTPEHEELKGLARGCVTRHHAEHYLGFFRTQWGLFEKERRIKPLLYAYRVLLTGIHLMETGKVEADLVRLAKRFGRSHLEELILQKVQGGEKDGLKDGDFEWHAAECRHLAERLESARDRSKLPDAPTARAGLEDLLLRVRGVG
jgi:uncharacterized protein